MKYNVALIKCQDYNLVNILDAFRKALALLEFDNKILEGKKVLLKPNMLGAYPPELGITTHPIFLEAAIILFQEFGSIIWVGDSANGIFPIDQVWERTGIREVCRRHNVIEKVFEKEGAILKDGIFIAKPVLEADFIVNLPRFKTHGLTVLTVATKNLYGCIPGLIKTRYHKSALNRLEFSKIVVRAAEIAKPGLNLVDGISAMDGNGPSAGRLIPMNVIICGTNHHAVDSVCAKLVGLDPNDIDTIEGAISLNLWNPESEIIIRGEDIVECRPKSFNLPKTFTKGMRDWWISRLVIEKIWNGISIKPKINKNACQRCGLCAKACPVSAIKTPKEMIPTGPPPQVVNKICIECYCCHEICPYKAIDLNESIGVKIGRFLGERRIKKLKK